MSGRAGRRTAVLLAVLVAGAALGTGLLAVPGAPGDGPRALYGAASSGVCAGSPLPSAYNGTVAIQDSTFIPVTPINYSYEAEVASAINGSAPYAYACDVENGTTHAAPDGEYNFSILATPQVVCGPTVGGVQFCNTTSGPYGAVTLAPAPPYPTGTEPVVTQNGTRFHIEFYLDLENVSLAPAFATWPVSSGAVATFDASAWSVLGTPCPVAPIFGWSLSGEGWSFADPPGSGPDANVTAAAGAAPGNLSVYAKLATAAGWVTTSSVTVALVAVPTMIVAASANRTTVDAGETVGFSLNGTGAPGLAYTTTLDPGLGLANVTAPCTVPNATEGPVALGCAIAFAYSANGTATPSLTLSNGASASTVRLSNISVAPAPRVEIVPGAPRGYVGSAVAVDVRVAPGTGTAPFARACLAPGAGPVACSTSSGPDWSFDPVYGAPGTYPLTAWVVDALGANQSAVSTATIAGPLGVDLAPPTVPLAGGAGTVLSASVSGGLWPARAWWNATDLAQPFAEANLSDDGNLSATFVPPSAGPVTVSLTIVDALGARVRSDFSATVLAGPATSIVAAALAGTPTTVAGTAAVLEWEARDPAGATVPLYASPAEISLTTAAGGDVAGWVNATGLGPLSSALPGWFDVPVGAWANGTLRVTIDVPSAGTIDVGLSVADGGPAPPAPFALTVLPDDRELRLFDPAPAESGTRSGATLWRVTDRFGNPVPGAEVLVTTTVGSRSTTVGAYAASVGPAATAVWVNYSVPGATPATVTVSDLAGDALLAPIEVGVPSPTLAEELLLVTVLPGAGAGAALGILAWRRRSIPSRDSREAPDDDPELLRLAEGRAAAIEIVRDAGAIDLAGIAARWAPPPAPPDLADWVASLVTDGTLAATDAGQGVARFALAPEPDDAVTVVVDPEELDRALRLRAAATRDDEP